MHFRKIRLKIKSTTQITAVWTVDVDNDNNVDDDYDDRSDRIYRLQSSIESNGRLLSGSVEPIKSHERIEKEKLEIK